MRSKPAVAMSLPSGLNATADTMPVWPVSTRRHSPEPVFQILIVPSPLAVASTLPSGLKAAP